LPSCSALDQWELCRYLARTDLYFLLWFVLGRKDIEKPWLFERCREVQERPDNCLDLWAREHYKSTIITFGKTLQDILASHGDDPLPQWKTEPTFGIFSHTRPIAKGFLRQIKRECETNSLLKALFPDVLYDDPASEAPKWSEDDGIVFRRRGNPKESTLEAWGLVDGQPTSKHFFGRIYDDVVTRESVSTPDAISKTTRALEDSFNLGTEGGFERFVGTRWHFSDTYKALIDRNYLHVRVHPGTVDGTVDGEPVLWSRETLAEKRMKMGPYVFGCQILLDPKSESVMGFKPEWIRKYKGDASRGTNRYILVDPANEKKKDSDYTSIWVIGLGIDGNYYALDMLRDRLSLTERGDALFRLHRLWSPLGVGYEKYGMQADIQYMQDRMERENYRFHITELGGSLAKRDRIRRLVPIFEQGRMWLPETLRRTDYQGVSRDLVDVFLREEYEAFPLGDHDDMLDSLARITDDDMHLVWPRVERPVRTGRMSQGAF
jgi:phage terminase large subunit-like protein